MESLAIALICAQASVQGTPYPRKPDPNTDKHRCYQQWGLRTLLGEDLHILDDVDGDQVADVLATCRDDNSDRLGIAYCLSGADGRVIWSLSRANGRLSQIELIGDVDHDGIRDFAALFPSGRFFCDDLYPSCSISRIDIFSGAEATLLRSDPAAGELTGREGRLIGLDDRDGDGVDDYAVVGRRIDSIAIRSGRSGEDLAVLGDGRTLEGHDLVVTRTDGVEGPVLLLGRDPWKRRPTVSAVSVATGTGGDFEGFGHVLADAGDLDGDGLPDWVATTEELWELDLTRVTTPTAVVAFSGATQEILWRADRPDGHEQAWFGTSVTRIGDRDGDSVDDLAVGSIVWFTVDASLPGIHVLSGSSGEVLDRLETPREFAAGSSLALLPEGPERPEALVVGGAYQTDNKHSETEGYVAVVEFDGEVRWIVRADALRIQHEEDWRVRIINAVDRLEQVNRELLEELFDGVLFRGR